MVYQVVGIRLSGNRHRFRTNRYLDCEMPGCAGIALNANTSAFHALNNFISNLVLIEDMKALEWFTDFGQWSSWPDARVFS